MNISKLLLLAAAVLVTGPMGVAVLRATEPDSKSESGFPPTPQPPSSSSPSPTFFGQAPFVPLPGDFTAGSPGQSVSGFCDRCPSYHGFMVGGGTYVMQARFDNNMAFGVQGTANRSAPPIPPGSPGVRLAQRIDIDHQMVAAPEMWLGYMSECGLGGRVRYWYFREGTDQIINGSSGGINSTMLFSAAPLGLGLVNGLQIMEATSKLQLQVWDAEAQYRLRAAGWNMLFSGGARFAQVDQSYNAFVPQKGNNALLSNNSFNGVGPTFAVELRHPLGASHVNLYGSVRGSLVFGTGHQTAGIPDQNVFAQDQRDIGIGIGEMELGLEYDHHIGRSRVFGQVAVVGQNWNGAGSASRSSVNVLPGGSFVGAAYTGDSDINFLGLALRLGVSF